MSTDACSHDGHGRDLRTVGRARATLLPQDLSHLRRRSQRARDSRDSQQASERVPSAFFMVGDHVRLFPELARRVAGSGHEIGNHTQNHVKLHFSGARRIREQLELAHAAIESATDKTPRVFRAPHGYRSPFLRSIIVDMRYTVFGWTFGVFDTARPGAEEIRRRVRKRLRTGAIVLLHDGDGYDSNGDRMQTAEALPGIIEDARARGYEFGSLAELLDN